MPPDVAIVGLDVPVGRLTALVAVPDGRPRGVALLVPGFTGSKEDFLPVLPLLRARGWLAVAYSRRGQPDSAAPVDRGDYLLDREAQDVLDVAAAVRGWLGPGLPLHLLGHSYGGLVARAAVLADAGPFDSFTMFCSGPRGWGVDGLLARYGDAGGVEGAVRAEFEAVQSRVTATPSLDDLPLDERFEVARLAAASPWSLRVGALTLATAPDSTAELAVVASARGLPVHVVHGDADDAWPIDWQHEMAERLGARYTVVPEAGHSAQRDQPEATAHAWSTFWEDVSS